MIALHPGRAKRICDFAAREKRRGTADAMTIQECYIRMGADYEEVHKRLCSEAMIRRFVLLFLEDDSYSSLKAALEAGDTQKAFRAAHTLRGVCQNLGFSNLCVPTAVLTETLRAGRLEDAKAQFSRVKKQYDVTADAIRELAELK